MPLKGRGAAKEALTALGQISSQHEVKLSASTADMSVPNRFRSHLTGQVHFDAVIDGHEVVNLGNDTGIIDVINRGSHNGRVIVST